MILVTGGTGLIGSEVLRLLSRAGGPARALVRNPGGAQALPGITWVQGDLAKPETLASVFAGCTKLFLLTGNVENASDLQRHAIAAARQAGERQLLSLHVARSCYYHYARSDYQAVCRTAEDGLALALEAGRHFDYLYCQFYRAQALLHLGRWGDMLHTLRDGLHMAKCNGHGLARQLLQLAKAGLHEQAGAFASARALCEQVLAQAQETRHVTGYVLSLMLLGCAHHGLGQAARANGSSASLTPWSGFSRCHCTTV